MYDSSPDGFREFLKNFRSWKMFLSSPFTVYFLNSVPMSRFNFNLWCSKTVICRNPSKIFPHLEQTEFKIASFLRKSAVSFRSHSIRWGCMVLVHNGVTHSPHPFIMICRFNFKVNFIFRISKSWIFYFCEWNEIKRNTTEYVGNLGH